MPKTLNDNYTIFQGIDILIIEDIDLIALNVKAQKQIVEIIDRDRCKASTQVADN